MTAAARSRPVAPGTNHPAGARHPAGYSFGPAAVDVDTDTADASRWLVEFLTPWVDVTTSGSGEALVHLTCSDPACEDLDRRRAAAGARLVPWFALDRQVVTLPGWDDGERTVLSDAEFGCFYQVHGRRVDILARPGQLRARVGLMRVVRELLAASRLARGGLLDIHAAAFAVGQRTVLIAGPKDAGKTTLLCYALGSGRARMVANDRVFVGADEGPGEVYGVPTLVSIRPGTLRLFPHLRRNPAERPALLHAGELEAERNGRVEGSPATPSSIAGPANVTTVRRDFALSPSQLARRMGASCARSAPIAVIVFPEISRDTDTWTVESLSPAEGLARLRTCFYGVHRERQSRTILEQLGGRGVSTARPETMADHLATRVRFVRCRLGPRAYEGSADDWLRALDLDAAEGAPRR